MSLADELRDRLRATGLSSHQISEKTGVSQTAVVRFLGGKDILLSTIEPLAEFLDMRWTEPSESSGEEPEPQKRKRRRRS